MILNCMLNQTTFSFPNSRYSFLPTGDIHTFFHNEIQVNRFTGNPLDGSPAGIWLRVHQNNSITAAPLFGKDTDCQMEWSKQALRYTGITLGISYELQFIPFNEGWLWSLELSGNGELVDVIYGQDVGLASYGVQLENELYVSQYLGHTIFETDNGYVLCSRQNMSQNGKNPYLQLGMLKKKAIAFSTDATQFFGLQYKQSDIPQALFQGLCCENYQFECAYLALQSEKFILNTSCHLSFYGMVLSHKEMAVSAPIDNIFATLQPLKQNHAYQPLEKCVRKPMFGAPYSSPAMPLDLLQKLYPTRTLPEEKDGVLLSFFKEGHAHVVTQAKELMVERPHGNIITTFLNTEQVDNDLLSSTCYIYGQFNSQTVLGNTSKHKLISASRGLLNRMKCGGMRIWVKLDEKYRLLNLPSIFETGLNYCRWHYLVNDDLITVTTFSAAHTQEIVTTLESKNNVAYSCLVTMQLVMGTHEFLQNMEITQNGSRLTILPSANSPIRAIYPELSYQIDCPDNSILKNDCIFWENEASQNHTLLTIQPPAQSRFSIRISGNLTKSSRQITDEFPRFEEEKEAYLHCFKQLLQGFSVGGNCPQADAINETVYWYTHNALIHFIVPHGLEQPGGAAWGTRDICQGPFEFFLSTQHFSMLRSILIHIFSHQHLHGGEWAQWFMFDRYQDEMNSCHGDVVFWPLKCVGDYLAATGDCSLLEQKVPFADSSSSKTMLAHIQLALDAIEKRFLEGTALISYAGGDWDDTLQPANSQLKECLVSSWTQALAFQVMKLLSIQLIPCCKNTAAKCLDLSKRIQHSFEEYLVIEGAIAGFVYRKANGQFCPMLHPLDKETGIHLRLLPMTRSIIAQLSSQQLAASSMRLVEEKLHCPDGVRLMDHPAPYHGGISHLFLRAEQAANIGREISLQYVHAHIRYIEALCKLGDSHHAWDALFEVNPITLHETVKNALPRQRNLYFSSSDGNFPDRYVYDQKFDLLKTGKIHVKGGWRLYSSGPGIYIRQLIANVFGIRVTTSGIEIDPVLPAKLDGATLTMMIYGTAYTFIFHLENGAKRLVTVSHESHSYRGSEPNSSYRTGGVWIPKEALGTETSIHINLYQPLFDY